MYQRRSRENSASEAAALQEARASRRVGRKSSMRSRRAASCSAQRTPIREPRSSATQRSGAWWRRRLRVPLKVSGEIMEGLQTDERRDRGRRTRH